MKSRAEYFREYRAKKGDATMQAKLDLLIEMVEQLLGGKKIVLPNPVPRPVIRSESIEPLQVLSAIKKVVDPIVVQSGRVCKVCGLAAFYSDTKGIYCSQHSPRDAKPI